MSESQFDKYLKQSLGTIEPDFTTDELWEEIEPRLKKKKRRFIILWFLIGASSMALLYWQLDFNTSSDHIAQESSKEIIENETQKPVQAEQKRKTDSVNPTETSQNGEVLLASAEAKLPTAIPDPRTKMENNSTVFNGSKNNEALYHQSDNSIEQYAKKDQKTQELATNTYKALAFEEEPKKVISKQGSNKSNRPESKSSEKIIVESIAKTDDDIEQSIDVFIKKESGEAEHKTKINALIPAPEKSNTSTKDAKRTENSLSKKASKLSNRKSRKLKKGNKKEKQSQKDKEKKAKVDVAKKKNPDWYQEISLSAAPVLAIHSIRINDDQLMGAGGEELEAARDEFEKQAEAFSFEFRYGWQHKKGLYLGIGLEYLQLNGSFRNNLTEVSTAYQDVVIAEVINGEGQVVDQITEEKLVTTTTTTNQQFANRYHFVNVPIALGIARRKRNYDYKFMGGLDLNLYFKFRGAISSLDGDVLFTHDLTNSSSSAYDRIFRRSAGLSLWFAGEYHRRLSERVNFVVSPRLNLPLGKLTQDDYIINHQLYRLGCQFGVNIWMNPGKKKRKYKS